MERQGEGIYKCNIKIYNEFNTFIKENLSNNAKIDYLSICVNDDYAWNLYKTPNLHYCSRGITMSSCPLNPTQSDLERFTINTNIVGIKFLSIENKPHDVVYFYLKYDISKESSREERIEKFEYYMALMLQ